MQHWHVLAILAVLLWPSYTTNGADHDLGNIRSELSRYTRLIETLQGRQVVAYKRDTISRAPGAPLVMEDLKCETEFKVDFLNSRTSLVENRSWYYREISPEPFSVQGEVSRYDGEISYALHMTPGHQPLPQNPPIPSAFPPNFPYTLLISGKGQKDQTADYHNIWRLAGLPCSGPNVSLAAALSAPDARILQKRNVDGVECVEVAATVGEWSIQASLDPTASWLPRHYFAARTHDPSGKRFTYEHTVTAFQLVPVHESGDRIWFPSKGLRVIPQAPVHLEMTLIDLEVNAPMKKADFEVDVAALPPGVQVRGPSSTTYTGNRKDLFDSIDRAIDEKTRAMLSIIEGSRGQSVPPSRPIRVHTATTPLAVSTFIALGSVIALLIGIRLALKRQS